MARASRPTLLSLDRWAAIMGISPAHFNGAVSAGGTGDPFPVLGCSDIWNQYSWQSNDRIGREDIALAIENAEQDIAEELGYWPAPKFIEEVHNFPRHYRHDTYDYGLDVRGMRKSVNLKWGKLIQQGRRNITYIGQAVDPATLVFNADYTVTATVATTLTEACEIKAYFEGENSPEWEIRTPISKSVDGVDVTFVFWWWQLIDPDLWEALPTGPPTALDLTGAIYVDTIDVYREFADVTEPTAQFFWEPKVRNIIPGLCTSCDGTGCPTCSLTTQDGCMYVRGVDQGIGVPVPGEYDEDEEVWVEQSYIECRAPDQVKVWYYAGDLDPLYLQHTTPTSTVRRRCDPLSNYWAEAIAWLATARLERNFCGCKQVTAFVNNLRHDMSSFPPDGTSFSLSEEILDNPFGTRGGEIRAWRKIGKLATRVAEVAVI